MSEGVSQEVLDETLTIRETKVLQLIADGKRLEEVAGIVGLHYQTVKRYVYLIRIKLDAPTTENAIATAIRRSVID